MEILEYTIKVNIPESKDQFLSGNGEGCWVLVTKEVKTLYDKDVNNGNYYGILSNNSYYYPDLKIGSRILFTMRGTKRPVVDWDFLIGLEKISDEDKNKLMSEITKKDQ